MAKSDVTLAFNEISELRKLPKETITDAVRQALVSAYRREYRPSSQQNVEATVSMIDSSYEILLEKEVIEDQTVTSETTEVTLAKARETYPDVQVGDMVMMPVELDKDLGRIAAQTAKQVISQKIREAERNQLYDEFKLREGELVAAQIQSISASQMTLALDRGEAIMPRKEMIPGERYHVRDKIRVVIAEVKKSSREPQVIVSRAHRNMLRRLLEYEVPEIYNRQVEIKNIAREPGARSKVAVAALQPGVDPLGACVGQRGGRIQNIVRELNDEKIDVIPWDQDQSVFISKALSPARVTGVYLEEDIDQGRTALVIVPDEQLSLAIGKEGQNARLAAKLTGWRIDIKSVTDAAIANRGKLAEPPLDRLANDQADLIIEVQRVLDKKAQGRPLQPEEYTTLARFVQTAEQRLLDYREISRGRRKRMMEKMRSTVPAWAFTTPLSDLNLPDKILGALKNIPTAGDLILRVQADTEKLSEVLTAGKCDEDALEVIKDALTDLLRAHKTDENAFASPDLATSQEGQPTDTLSQALGTAPPEEDEEDDEDAPPAFVDAEASPASTPEAPRMKKIPKYVEKMPELALTTAPVKDEDDEDDDRSPGGKKGKKNKKGRQLVYDEDRGTMVVKRNRKRGLTGEWEDEE
jgi:N utilization substance protein A